MTPVTLKEWYTLAIFLISLFSLIAIAEKLRSFLHWPAEVTRKFVHIITGILIFFTPYLFHSAIPLLLLALFFIAVNYLGIRKNLFQGMHGTERQTYGTVFYPIAFLVLVLLFWSSHQVIIQLGMLILAVADALAAIVGENIKHPHNYHLTKDNKSWAGSATMALTSFAIVAAGLFLLNPVSVLPLTPGLIFATALLVALIATVAEAISWSGSDNLSAPLAAAFVLHFILTHAQQQNLHFSIGIFLALVVALVSLRLRFLDAGGAGVTFLLGTIIFGIGGWVWGVPILAFFLSSSVLSKLWRERKKATSLLFEKTSKRDVGQVLANGGMAALVILIYYVTSNDTWYLIYLATLAAVTADTWATEIGVLAKEHPRLITTFEKVAPGTSGAISLIGSTGALLGSAFIALIGYWLQPAIFRNLGLDLLLITASGLAASLVDSLLGATIQAQFRCPVCHKLTEKKVHCNGVTTQFESGFTWVNNDFVNSVCALSGVLLMALSLQFF